ncbi:hypothetical protein [Tannerella forsythia]|uniref:Uncharacterized protein n=1 Tax=Tannerella forsythia TaxID=28112 RepID=A0A2A6EAN0_TANFO|nr:hypothetical protein [Tannerella forsythia]PDP44686.1 hypothetical protein CLI86_02070 [Tannerella forsythia]
MYQIIDGRPAISVNDWCRAGLTLDMFKNDSKRGYLSILRRGTNGNTIIDVRSIKRPDRLKVIEEVMGRVPSEQPRDIYEVREDYEARDFYTSFRKPDGQALAAETVRLMTAKASIFNALRDGMRKQIERRAASGSKLKKGVFWETMLDWHSEQCRTSNMRFGAVVPEYTNVRSFERAFKNYLNDGYTSLLPKNIGNDSRRKVSRSAENLLLSLWRTHDKPFISRVSELYQEFVSGTKEIFDKETGEVFRPKDFMYKGRPLEICEQTIWLYLKDVMNNTAVYADRNGNFDFVNSQRPKNVRKLGQYSLSKISMDDVALSRKSVRGWVYKYICVDVVSGYYFRPAYVVGKPSLNTVYESFRNVFCELQQLGLPMPGELEVEHHLMQDIEWLGEAFQYVRFCTSPTEKRAEHNIKALKWGTAKKWGHTRGRWYAKSEAYRSVRNKVSGDYVEPEYQPQTIVADDLADIERHNNSLHPLQRKYPGMTRRDVLLKYANPNLQRIAPEQLYKFIGNDTETTIRNNDYVAVANAEFCLTDFDALKRLKANNRNVTAYWLPDEDGSVSRVYLYQGDTYIGEAIDRGQFAYNECAIERTEEDEAKMLEQYKRAAKFDKKVRDRRAEIPHTGMIEASDAADIASVAVDIMEITENEQPDGYEEDEFTDWSQRARDMF